MIRSGAKYPPDDADGYTYLWTVVSPPVPDELALQIHEDRHNTNAAGWYSGPGRSFAFKAAIRRTGTRVRVRQITGLDI